MNIKQLTNKQLDSYLDGFVFKTEPFRHQKISILFAKDKDRVAFFHSIGSGKTACSLYTAQVWDVNRILVVCPTSVITTWKQEVRKHTDWSFEELTGTTQERFDKFLQSSANVDCINWAGLKYLFCSKGEKGFELDADKFVEVDYDCLILDESHKCKDYRTIQSKIVKLLSQIIGKCIMLTGSPISNNELNLWNQYDVLDQGKTLGRNFFVYRNNYFKPIKHKTRNRSWTEWKLKSLEHREQILDKISKSTLRYDISECMNLPEVSYVKRYVNLTKKQRDFIDDIVSNIQINEDDVNLSKSNYNKAMKIAQITGGTVLDDDGESYIFKKNPKLNELEDILMETDEKVIIFHAFVEEGREIEKLCKKNNWNYASLRSEIKNKSRQIERFQNDKNCRFLITHPMSGGLGLNLQMARIAIFYSIGFLGHLIRQQAEGRIKRAGQNKTCLFIDLVAKNSIDEHLLEAISDKRKIAEAILNYLSKL